MTIFRFFQSPKDSLIGDVEPLPSAFIFWNIGDSLSDSRIQTEIASRMIDIRNGMRQPQASKSSLPSHRRQARITSSDMNRPKVAVVWIHEVNRPRLCAGACSAT